MLHRWAKRLYWVVGIIALVLVCMLLFKQNKQIASVLVFMGGIIALYFYYIKWFLIPEAHPGWPPYVTPCPDFLTLIDPGDPSTGKPGKCIDYVGVSANGRLKKIDPASADISMQTEPGDYIFEINTKDRDPATGEMKDVSKKDICDQVDNMGLVWISMCGE
jgi:hypothetical protein